MRLEIEIGFCGLTLGLEGHEKMSSDCLGRRWDGNLRGRWAEKRRPTTYNYRGWDSWTLDMSKRNRSSQQHSVCPSGLCETCLNLYERYHSPPWWLISSRAFSMPRLSLVVCFYELFMFYEHFSWFKFPSSRILRLKTTVQFMFMSCLSFIY